MTLAHLPCLYDVINGRSLFQVGIALKPNTSVDVVTEFVDEADMILIMTVEPGMYKTKL